MIAKSFEEGATSAHYIRKRLEKRTEGAFFKKQKNPRENADQLKE